VSGFKETRKIPAQFPPYQMRGKTPYKSERRNTMRKATENIGVNTRVTAGSVSSGGDRPTES